MIEETKWEKVQAWFSRNWLVVVAAATGVLLAVVFAEIF